MTSFFCFSVFFPIGYSYVSVKKIQINHLSDGMKIGLTDKVEKHSEKLGRDAVFTLNSRIKRLPRYLCIQVKLLVAGIQVKLLVYR